MTEYLLIPHDRIGVLIGPKGQTKKRIEKNTKTKIEIDSSTGEIEITMKGNAIDFMKAIKIVKAIARGFSPENAMLLLIDDNILEIIELREIIGKNENKMKAKKGRVIGRKGKARKEIEQESNVKISVYGKTISIIGKNEDVEKAKKAIQLLLFGASHSTAYESLKNKYYNQEFEL
ncbi:MAG: KH domain-containing protein [Candidatus Diapherotrites archaeon]